MQINPDQPMLGCTANICECFRQILRCCVYEPSARPTARKVAELLRRRGNGDSNDDLKEAKQGDDDDAKSQEDSQKSFYAEHDGPCFD